MNLLTHTFIIEKYGIKLNAEKLANWLEINKPGLYKISDGT